ncbi:hypothetical protein M5103_004682 [Vibrio alginolyticus]|nr:hypothetical protein [Vibrio alginolyticus]ELB2939123.1 hypothetical protein [Vibrio alginolyticus]
MSPQIYNEKRRIIFSTYHGKGRDLAFQYLEGYRNILGAAGYAGLRAEMEFYDKYRKEFNLTIAGDMGEHADFSGLYGRAPVRFDVTTNISCKELKTYEKFICDGFDYKIALYDQTNWEIIDVLELSFPKCNNCGDSFMFPLALLQPGNVNLRGEPLWHNDQKIIELCPCCGEMKDKAEIYNTTVRTSSEVWNDIPLDYSDDERGNLYLGELRSSVKYLSKTTTSNLVGLVEEGFIQEHKYNDGFNALYFPYLNGVVNRHFPPNIPV